VCLYVPGHSFQAFEAPAFFGGAIGAADACMPCALYLSLTILNVVRFVSASATLVLVSRCHRFIIHA